MRLVHQNGEDGCGIACVAMVAGVTYDGAKDELPGYWERKGTTKKQMRHGLRHYGIKTSAPKSIAGKNYKEFEFDAVLLGYWDEEMHWTVWDFKHKKLLDPYRGRSKFRCTSFIRIEAKNSN
jgi:ABC-type bacteriocin/lantibiotic exporter with double-glycine peptidase domain